MTHQGEKMETTNVLRKLFVAATLLMVTTATYAQRHGGGHHSSSNYQVESSARNVAQSARSLKQSLEMMDGRRRDRRGRHQRGLYPIINAVQSVAQDARQVARDASMRSQTDYSFRQLQRSFTAYKRISVAIQNNPRLSYEVRAVDSAMSQLTRDMQRGGGHQGTLEKAKRLTRKLSRVTSNLASSVSSDLRYRRYQTQAERQALRATSDLSREAAELSRVTQNSRPALRRTKQRFETFRMTFKQAKRALRNVTTSYTVSDQLQKAKELVRKLADTLQASHGGTSGGFTNPGNSYGFN
jgi:hypothetical protein